MKVLSDNDGLGRRCGHDVIEIFRMFEFFSILSICYQLDDPFVTRCPEVNPITDNNIINLNFDYFIANQEFCILEANTKRLVHCIIHIVFDKCFGERPCFLSVDFSPPSPEDFYSIHVENQFGRPKSRATRSRGRPEGSLFNSFYEMVGEGATSFPCVSTICVPVIYNSYNLSLNGLQIFLFLCFIYTIFYLRYETSQRG